MLPSLPDTDFIIFLDESGDHNLDVIDPYYPVFCLAGCVFSTEEYIKDCVPKVHCYKQELFGTTDVILHSRDIRKNSEPFNALRVPSFREKFYEMTEALMSNLNYWIICSVIKKVDLKFWYATPDSPYSLTLTFIMERFRHFLCSLRKTGYVIVESRGKKENQSLLADFNSILTRGTAFLTPGQFTPYIKGLSFYNKSQNISGLQLADLCAYPLGRKVLDPLKENPSFNIISPKLYDGFRKEPKKYGYKIFP